MKKLLFLLLFCLFFFRFLDAQIVTISNMTSSGTDDCITADEAFFGQAFTANGTGTWTALQIYIGNFPSGTATVYVDKGQIAHTSTSNTKQQVGTITSGNGVKNFTFSYPVIEGQKYVWWVQVDNDEDICYQVASTVFGEANDYLHSGRSGITESNNSGQINSQEISTMGGRSALFSATINKNGSIPVLSSSSKKAWVPNYGSGSLSIIDINTNEVNWLEVGEGPSEVVFSADGAKAFVPNIVDNTISVINTTTNTITATIPVGVSLEKRTLNIFGIFDQQVVFSTNCTKALVGNRSDGSINVIDFTTNTVTATIPGASFDSGSSPIIAISPDGSKGFYLTAGSSGAGTVTIIDLNTNTTIATIPSSNQDPYAINISPDGTKALVASSTRTTSFLNVRSGVEIDIIDLGTNTVISTLPVADAVLDFAFSSDGTKVFVTVLNPTSTVNIINLGTNMITSVFPLTGIPLEIDLSPDGTKAFVRHINNGSANPFPENYSLIDLATNSNDLIATANINLIENDLWSGLSTISPDGTQAFVANQAAGTVSVFDLVSKTQSATIQVGSIPDGVSIFCPTTIAPLTGNDLSVSDPCSCNDSDNIKDSNTGEVTLFHDVLTVRTTPGVTVRLSATDNNLLDVNGNPIAVNTTLNETSTGVYTLTFYTRPNISASVTVSNGVDTENFTTTSCTSCLSPIPTLSAWSLLIFGLLLLNLGVGFIYRKELI